MYVCYTTVVVYLLKPFFVDRKHLYLCMCVCVRVYIALCVTDCKKANDDNNTRIPGARSGCPDCPG